MVVLQSRFTLAAENLYHTVFHDIPLKCRRELGLKEYTIVWQTGKLINNLLHTQFTTANTERKAMN